MNDFFYYSMIRSKKENTTRTRKLEGFVPVDELPNLMRAMGYYPTNQEIANMKSEVRFASYPSRGEPNNRVTIEEFIKLFVNHRPVYGIGKNNIEEAFKAIIEQSGEAGDDYLHNMELLASLKTTGEEIGEEEISEILHNLVSEKRPEKAFPDQVTSDKFAEDILGFEEVDEEAEEGEEGEGEEAALQATD
jgi:cilia- and flagella-associated protein 251